MTLLVTRVGKQMKASSLSSNLADVHDIYQQTVVAQELLELWPPVTYTVSAGLHVRGLLVSLSSVLFGSVQVQGQLDDAATLSGRTPPLTLSVSLLRDASHGARGVRCAGEPLLPQPCANKIMPGRGGTSEATRDGNSVCFGPSPAVHGTWGCSQTSGGLQIPQTDVGTGQQ
jgi:hypothetical protein